MSRNKAVGRSVGAIPLSLILENVQKYRSDPSNVLTSFPENFGPSQGIWLRGTRWVGSERETNNHEQD